MSVWYEYKTKIDTRDVDGRSRCRPSALLSYLQEAATLAAESRCFGREVLMTNYGAFLMLARLWFRLDRPLRWGEELTIHTWHRGGKGASMYRDFDLSVPQAALGSIKNSSAWTTLEKAGKAAVIETLFKFLNDHTISTDEAVAKIKAAFDEVGLDYNKALDGVVDGGVCFNRELYNQKLEWDQFENVTYDLDITRNQLNLMTMYLGGNNGKFSILKNSCATVALRAWNAAVGTRNGEDTAYKLTSVSDGIFQYIDAPKGVRDNIRDRLPGYYLNNAEGVAEPDASYLIYY